MRLKERNNIFKFLGLVVLLLGLLLGHNQLGSFLEIVLAHAHLQEGLLLGRQLQYLSVLVEQFEEVLGLGVCDRDVGLRLVDLLTNACGCSN